MRCSCVRAYERVYTCGLVCFTLKAREIKRLGRVRITGAETGEASSSGSAAGVYGCLRLFPDVYVASEIEKIKRLRRRRVVEIAARKLRARTSRKRRDIKADRYRRGCTLGIETARPKSVNISLKF